MTFYYSCSAVGGASVVTILISPNFVCQLLVSECNLFFVMLMQRYMQAQMEKKEDVLLGSGQVAKNIGIIRCLTFL